VRATAYPSSTTAAVLDVGNVIWGTGFTTASGGSICPWSGPMASRGAAVSTTHPGLYYVGQHFLLILFDDPRRRPRCRARRERSRRGS
jgi:hypothetical protein